jgi:membrane-associated protease RseP (regulator of RpoE activity)
LNFHLGSIPVRVHPLFWLAALILGARGFDNNPDAGPMLLIWVGVIFVSIMVHELGHAITMRYFGQGARIVMYMLGGLAIPDSSGWGWTGGRPAKQTPQRQILISFAGPAAGFLLAGLVLLSLFALGGACTLDLANYPGMPGYPLLGVWIVFPPELTKLSRVLLIDLLWVNIFWGLLNLCPVYPLDGGQIARELFTLRDPWHGITRSLWLSVFTGVGLAILGLVVWQSLLMILLFGSLAVSSYMALQQFGGGGGFGGRPW